MRQRANYYYKGKTSFNPRICKRCDSMATPGSNMSIVSIHASVKDATNFQTRHLYSIVSFNPRICKRCDKLAFKRFSKSSVSIHASVKDATRQQNDAINQLRVSIHASVKDATWVTSNFLPISTVSIHASVKDATNTGIHHSPDNKFQSTHL